MVAAVSDAVQTVLQDRTLLNAGCYMVGCFLGQVIFWITRWANDEQWVTANFKRTVAAIGSNIGIMAGFVAMGSLESAALGTALFVGLTQGIAADSIINKGTRKVFTEEEREEERQS